MYNEHIRTRFRFLLGLTMIMMKSPVFPLQNPTNIDRFARGHVANASDTDSASAAIKTVHPDRQTNIWVIIF